MFYYNCGSKFVVDGLNKYFEKYEGSITFVNGEECFVYKYNGMNGVFENYNSFNSVIPNKHKKGGQSSVRFGRIADNIRSQYISRIIEAINKLENSDCNWIFGSRDILDDVIQSKSSIRIKMNFGDYIDFDKHTIQDTHKWIGYMQSNQKNDEKLKRVCELFSKSPELLNFGNDVLVEQDKYRYIYINKKVITLPPDLLTDNKYICFDETSKYYDKLHHFPCIGEYYCVEMHNDNDDEN